MSNTPHGRVDAGSILSHEPLGSVGVSPASRKPKTGTRRRDASAPRNCAPVQGFNARFFFLGNSQAVSDSAGNMGAPISGPARF